MSSKPPTGKRMKARAPSPPQAPQPAPRNIFRTPVTEGGNPGTDAKENILRPRVHLQVTLPQGYQTSLTEDGSKALMDLLVELCSHFHLNPAVHTLELFSPEGDPLGFKPNYLLGSLNVACVLIKEKVVEEKVVRKPAPKVPEKTVRLMVNYRGSQKAVVRVNPFVPLQTLLPVICEKCDFDPAHVLLLKDSVSRHELELDKSLTDLEIKELYVHDQSLVLQPKMASAPALNYSDSIHSSTSTLSRTERKSFLGIFHLSRRKSKTQSMDTDAHDDKITQNTDAQTSGLSTMSRVFISEDEPTALGVSQSVMNIPQTSPTVQIKKRRAPALPGAPPVTMGHANFERYQMGVGSESQQKKRKAPVPPSNTNSATPGPDNVSASVTPTPANQTAPAPVSVTKVAQSSTSSVSAVTKESENPLPMKRAVGPPAAHAATPSSSSKSSSTLESGASNDSSSELSHSLEDTDTDIDPDQTGSQCSSLSSSTVSSSVLVQPTIKSSSNHVEESEKSLRTSAKSKQETTTASNSRPQTDLDLNLKLDEAEKRHSAMAWVHSMQNSKASCQKPDTEAPEEETISFGSSSVGSSLPDQSFPAFEELADGEDSGMVSSPSDTQPTSPEGSLSLDGCRTGGERMLGSARDNSSDSDEGCAPWQSKQRHKDNNPQAVSGRLESNYKDDPKLTVQLHQTLATFETDLANHTGVVSGSMRNTVTGRSEVPVSVVDMDVPVTAIDEVLEDFDCKIPKNETKLLTGTKSTGKKGQSFSHESSIEPQNKNNNARTAAESNKKSRENVKKLSKTNQSRESLENQPKSDKREDRVVERKIREVRGNKKSDVKTDKQKPASSAESNIGAQKTSMSTEIKPGPLEIKTQSFQDKKPVISSTTQKTASIQRHEEFYREYQTNASSNSSHGKITPNVISRFGTKTFTVVPSKPSVSHASTKVPAATLSLGAIKIDDQGNMVKAGITHNKVGGSLNSSEIDDSEGSLLLEKAKAFWSLSERQEGAVLHNKGLIDKAKETADGLKSPPPAASKCERKTSNSTDSSPIKPTEKFQPKRMVKTEARQAAKEFSTKVEVENKISASKHIQQVSNKPVVSPFVVPDLRKDLSLIKTSRRTSSQYVASAINKYTTDPLTKPNSTPTVSHTSTLSSQSGSLQRSGQPMPVNQHKTLLSFTSDNKENEAALKLNPPGLEKMSSSENLARTQRDFSQLRMNREEFGSSAVSKERNSNTLETGTTKNKHIQSTGTTHINTAPIGDTDNTKHPQSPRRTDGSLQNSAVKSPTEHKSTSQGHTSNTLDMANTSLIIPGKAQTSFTETDGSVSSGALPVSVFGPVKKFRPVVCRSVDKETSLHSSLMEAIQTGRGRDGLRKMNTPGLGPTKKTLHVEEENERSALLGAIRAQSSCGRLRKTKSEAAEELERFRKASEEAEGAGPHSCPSTPSATCATPPVFTPTPPLMPQPAMNAPPPPPPALLRETPNGNSPMNAALAREAMLEAIRSGDAADKLKKVAAPKKTVKVNGRLGTIQPTSTKPDQ